MSRRISLTYRKVHTCWQHHILLNDNMKHTTTTPTRTRKTLRTTAVALVIMTSGILATLVYQPASSSPPTISAVLRRDHDNPPTEDSGETSQLGAPVRPAGDLENDTGVLALQAKF